MDQAVANLLLSMANRRVTTVMPERTRKPRKISFLEALFLPGAVVRRPLKKPQNAQIEAGKAIEARHTIPNQLNASAKNSKAKTQSINKQAPQPAQNGQIAPGQDAARSDIPEYTFSEQQDAQLRELKALGKTWAQIESELGKPRWQCQKRFKELQGRGGQGQEQGKAGQAKEEGGTGKGKAGKGGEEGRGKAGRGEEKRKMDQVHAGPSMTELDAALKRWYEEQCARSGLRGSWGSRADGSLSDADEASETDDEVGDNLMLEPDGVFDSDDLQLLVELLVEEKERFWINITRHFTDMTGKRVTARDVQAKLGPIVNHN